MFFLIRYQTVVASRRLINFARQFFSRVTLVRMTASSVARHFLRTGVFIFPRGIKMIGCQVGVLEEKKLAEWSPSSSYASAPGPKTRAFASPQPVRRVNYVGSDRIHHAAVPWHLDSA
jgi:hypothetical protein